MICQPLPPGGYADLSLADVFATVLHPSASRLTEKLLETRDLFSLLSTLTPLLRHLTTLSQHTQTRLLCTVLIRGILQFDYVKFSHLHSVCWILHERICRWIYWSIITIMKWPRHHLISWLGWPALIYIYKFRKVKWLPVDVCVWGCVCLLYSQLRTLFTYFGEVLRCPHKRVITITIVYIARNNIQVELIRFRTN